MKNRLFSSLFIVFLLLLAAAHCTQAQEKPTGGVWTLEECIKYAIKNNVTVMQTDLQIESTNNNLIQSKASRYPNVNLNASQNLNFGRSIDPFTNQFVNQRVNSNNFSLNASMNVFNGFQTQNTIKQNQVLLERNQLDSKQSRNNVALNVALGYLNILQNKELLIVAEKNIESTKIQLDRTQKLFDAGASAEIDVINVKSTLAGNELALVNAQNQLAIAKINLQQNMNIIADENFDIQTVSIESLNVNEVAETTAQIYGIAESTQPNIKSADLSIKSSAYSIDIAKGNRLPSLTLNATLFSGYSSATTKPSFEPIFVTDTVGFLNNDRSLPVIKEYPSVIGTKTDYGFASQVNDNFRQQFSFNLSIPIFNGWQVKNQIANATINKRNAELTALNTRNQLRQTIEQAYIDAKNAFNTYQAREKQLDALEITFNTTEKRYEAGASNVVDFNLARVNRDNARSDLVRAKYDYLFRKKVLDFYMDKPLSID